MRFLNPRIPPLLLLPIFVLLFYLEFERLSGPLWGAVVMGFMLWMILVGGEKVMSKLDDRLCRWLDKRRAREKR